MNLIDSFIKSEKFGRYVKIFLINMVAMFLMVALPKLGVKIVTQNSNFQGIVSPLPTKENLLNKIMPKLQEKVNSFKLQKSSSLILVPTVQASGEYDNANGYAVVDFNTGEVLAEKNLSKKIPLASITKVMTAVTALDLLDKDELITITQRAADREPTKIGIVAGQKMTLEELINAALLTSANDATQAIADGVDAKYGENGLFVKAMNAKATSMGLRNTQFENVMGLDGANQYSSPEDIAIFTHYALTNYPLITEIVKKDYKFYPADKNHKQFDLYNWNGLLGVYPGVAGVKIGNTEDAGYTTSLVSEREGKKVIVVMLGAPGVLKRDQFAASLLDLGFEKLGLKPVKITEQQLKDKYSTWKYFN